MRSEGNERDSWPRPIFPCFRPRRPQPLPPEEIRKFDAQANEEFVMLAKRQGSMEIRPPVLQLITSHLRPLAKIAMGYRGYGRFRGDFRECRPDATPSKRLSRQGLPPRHLRHVVDSRRRSRIRPAVLVLRRWHHREPQKKLFFNLRKIEPDRRWTTGNPHPDQMKLISPTPGSSPKTMSSRCQRLSAAMPRSMRRCAPTARPSRMAGLAGRRHPNAG